MRLTRAHWSLSHFCTCHLTRLQGECADSQERPACCCLVFECLTTLPASPLDCRQLPDDAHRTQTQQPVGGLDEMVAERVLSRSPLQQAAAAHHEVTNLRRSLQGIRCRGTLPCSLPQPRDHLSSQAPSYCQRPILSWRPASKSSELLLRNLRCQLHEPSPVSADPSY